MKTTILCIVFGLCTFLLLSCNNDLNDAYDLSEDTLIKKNIDNIVSGSLGMLKQIEEDDHGDLKEILSKMKTNVNYSAFLDRESNASSNLYAINGLPIYIKSRYDNNSKQYLEITGVHREAYLSSLNSNSIVNTFYIEKYGFSSGISEVIYSMQTKTPIVLGYYKNNRDKLVLFASNSKSYSSSANWSLEQTNTNEYVYIKSNSNLEFDTNGDIYYPSMGVSQYNKIEFGRYISGNAKQEFKIELVNGFTIDEIEFVNPYNSATIEILEPLVVSGTYINNKNTPDPYASINIVGNKIEYPKSIFKTKLQNIAYKLTNPDFKVAKPICIDKKLYLNANSNDKKILSYNGTKYKDNLNISKKLDLSVDKKTIVNYKYYINQYLLGVDYKIKASYNHNGDIRVITLTGRWSGIVYSDDLNNVEFEIIKIGNNGDDSGDFDLKSSKTMIFNVKENKKINLIQ